MIKENNNWISGESDEAKSYASDTMLTGRPDWIVRARDLQDVSEALVFASQKSLSVTFCGSQTSMTGASVAENGLLISTEKMDKLLDISKRGSEYFAIAQPGIIISDLKKRIASEHLFYPPAPTSQDVARLGATISTNATGEDTYQYGTTRRYVEEIKVLLSDGACKTFERSPDEIKKDSLNLAGYLWQSKNPLDWFIGGEGTLGFIYEARVRLLPEPPDHFTALFFFPTNESALNFIFEAHGKLHARSLEFIDAKAFEFMRQHPTFPQSLLSGHAVVYVKQEYEPHDLKSSLGTWNLLAAANQGLLDHTVVAESERQRDQIRLWRHHIPLTVNEEYRKYWGVGGGKIGSDWWVPMQHMREMMRYVYKTGQDSGVPFFAFAHLGNGHPHVNYLCRTANEKIKAKRLLLACCKKAVSFGGGVSGEHGIGKIHRDYLALQWGPEIIKKMRHIKESFDPAWTLGRGNILLP